MLFCSRSIDTLEVDPHLCKTQVNTKKAQRNYPPMFAEARNGAWDILVEAEAAGNPARERAISQNFMLFH